MRINTAWRTLQQALADAGVKGIELEEPRVLQLRHPTDGSADGGRAIG
ncbi:MAG: hypothetical protein U0231_12685 [Nitrospiraceae bacterium]